MDFRQKSSTMLGALSLVRSTAGTKNSGLESSSASVKPRSSRIVMWIGLPQQAHSVAISKDRASFLNLPCTKGVATASVPHAASRRSPVLKARWCGVLATVTG